MPPSDEGGGICEANDGGRDRAAMRQARRICPSACPVSDGVLFNRLKSTQKIAETSLVSDFQFLILARLGNTNSDHFSVALSPTKILLPAARLTALEMIGPCVVVCSTDLHDLNGLRRDAAALANGKLHSGIELKRASAEVRIEGSGRIRQNVIQWLRWSSSAQTARGGYQGDHPPDGALPTFSLLRK